MDLSIILPCRNEELSLENCIVQIKKVIEKNNLNAEIIVSDSSSDKSPEIAKKNKVVLIKHNKEGYGIAYLEAFKRAKGKFIFMADCDGTYNFNEIPKFLKKLKEGYDFVIGDRFKGNIEKKAMPWHHQYIGNPILSSLLRLFYNTSVKDVHCGMRAISKEALTRLNLQTTGMEFASEMVIKAVKNNLRINQIPINYSKRKGKSKLNSFVDGWRHLRFMLLYSPLFLFFIPGIILFLIGIASMSWLYFSPNLGNIRLFYHPLFVSSLLIILGYQLITFSAFAKTYAITHLKEEEEKCITSIYKYVTIEKASLLGLGTILGGLFIYLSILIKWINNNFGQLNEISNSVIALTLIVIGIQTIFASFMLSILGIKEK